MCHSCDNPPCVNPAHLFAGDAAINYEDMVAKGRRARGVRTNAKLTEEAVREIRQRHPGESMAALAAAFGVSKGLVQQVIERRVWRAVV